MAILVPSESEESRSEIASSLTLLAMTEKGTPRNDMEVCLAMTNIVKDKTIHNLLGFLEYQIPLTGALNSLF